MEVLVRQGYLTVLPTHETAKAPGKRNGPKKKKNRAKVSLALATKCILKIHAFLPRQFSRDKSLSLPLRFWNI